MPCGYCGYAAVPADNPTCSMISCRVGYHAGGVPCRASAGPVPGPKSTFGSNFSSDSAEWLKVTRASPTYVCDATPLTKTRLWPADPNRCWHCALLLLLCALATGWPDRPRRSQHCSLERVQDATLNKRTEHCGNSGNAHEEHTLVSGIRLGIEHYPLRTAAALRSVNGTGPQLPIATD